MKNFKRVVSVCLLSMVLASSMSLSAIAVDDGSVLTTESEVGDSGGIPEEEQSTDSEVTDESEISDSSNENTESSVLIPDESVDVSELSTEGSSTDPSESSEPSDTSESSDSDESSDISESSEKVDDTSKESSQDEESSKGDIQQVYNSIKLSIDFGCRVLSNTSSDGRIDFSNVSMTLLSADKKTVIKRFDIKSILEEQPMVSTYTQSVQDSFLPKLWV